MTGHHERVRALHERLLAGDRMATADLYRLLLGSLVARLRYRWPRLAHTDATHDEAMKVLNDYLAAPKRYDAARKPRRRLVVADHNERSRWGGGGLAAGLSLQMPRSSRIFPKFGCRRKPV
jgi:hypothetical protein